MQMETSGSPKFGCRVTSPVITVWHTDDDPSCRNLVAQLLNRVEGIRCARGFESAELLLNALEVVAPPAVILLDLNMKGMNGIDAIAPIKAIAGDNTAIIIFTTFSDLYAERLAVARGASAFLLKRAKVDDLVQTIRHYADQSHTLKPRAAGIQIKELSVPALC